MSINCWAFTDYNGAVEMKDLPVYAHRLGHIVTRVTNNALPAKKTINITTTNPSIPPILNPSDGGAGGRGAGQLAAQSTQLHATLPCNNHNGK